MATHQQISESAVLKRLLEMTLQSAGELRADDLDGVGKGSRASRLYVRLQADDQLLLAERAAARHMASATYVSVLVRTHLRGLAPLPKDELLALKRSVAELNAVGRLLNQIARAANQGDAVSSPSREYFGAMLKVCEGLRDHVAALIKATVLSWTAGHPQ